ncbi:urea carboxylase-associated family protein, partial [Escherichia coli]|uniref:urea carboxylase-associated family protein n=2 Tax=Pseudomonadota TaxID=1224 RepID=UPI000E20CEA1
SWYGWDEDGGGVHDVIGTRCDPYTNKLLSGGDYHHCCHSNLTNALASAKGLSFRQAEPHVHDVLNVFMCTGFTRDTHQYFMKASPVRPGDYL